MRWLWGMLVCGVVHAETLVGNGERTNRIELGAGDVVMIQTATVILFTGERHCAWEGVELWPGDEPSVRVPMVLAGPGTFSVSYPHVMTYEVVRATNVVTRVLKGDAVPVRIAVGAGQRLSMSGYGAWNGGLRRVTMVFLAPGEELTDRVKDTRRLEVFLGMEPKVFDGPLDVVMWALQDVVVTWRLEAKRSIKVEASVDLEHWETWGEIAPGTDAARYYRLAN